MGMTLLRINATQNGLRLHGSHRPIWPSIAHATHTTQDDGPVVIMVHGFRFAPGARSVCPHQHILSSADTPRSPKSLSWPRALGFGAPSKAPGLGIAFGWNALGSIWAAFDEATRAGVALSSLINQLHRLAPDRPIHLIGHSMGARVVLSALANARAHTVARVLLLAPAEYRDTASRALQSPAGQTAEVFNITSRENDLFDYLLERLIPRADKIMGSAPLHLPNLLTIQLDDPNTLAALRRHGIQMAPTQPRICHWSAYIRPGVFDLYRTLLFAPHRLPLKTLQADLPSQMHPRWVRFGTPLSRGSALPLAHKAPSWAPKEGEPI
jgi:pimeloyl-ACP methyl ester carboxylesterase